MHLDRLKELSEADEDSEQMSSGKVIGLIIMITERLTYD